MTFAKSSHAVQISAVAVFCLIVLGCDFGAREVESAVYRHYKGMYPDGCSRCSKALSEYNAKLMKEHRSHMKDKFGVIFGADLISCEVCKMFCPRPDVCSVENLPIERVKAEKSDYDDIWNVTITGAKCSKTSAYAVAPSILEQFHYSKGRLTFLKREEGQ